MTHTGFGLLSLITFFPLVGALAIALLNKEAVRNARWIALYTTLFTFGASIRTSRTRASCQGPAISRPGSAAPARDRPGRGSR